MKSLISVMLVLFLVGCGANSSNITPQTNGITFDCDVTYYNESYECKGKVAKDGDMKIEFLAPEDIKGLEFEFTQKGANANFKDIKFASQKIVFENSVATFLYDVLSDKNKILEDNNTFYTEGVTDEFEYKLQLGGTGLPIKITTRPDAVEVIFKNVKLK